MIIKGLVAVIRWRCLGSGIGPKKFGSGFSAGRKSFAGGPAASFAFRSDY